ncbi:MAG: hypothetical protein CMJ06_05990 [Pelagibacterales bacterium]|nr:hypothetical protein [Pelagibacterales bacterium]OUU61185.1 MAG: hypothetical protein CBC22_08135 [Alphaproteobacteria bacterium TMED62]|tara:strand:+ start:1720 stop:2520 length:801 start_codon:yes stop_codon:yes gene_type:complete
MEEKRNNKKNDTADTNKNEISFLKIDKLKRGSHALSLLLRNEDIIVGFNGKVFRGSQKVLNQNLNIEENKIITIFRKEIFFNLKVNGPLGIKLVEVANDEADDLLIKTDNYFKNIKDLNKYKEFEVYKGKKNFYDVIEVLDTSLLASLLPFIWFYHHRLYSPLLLLIATFLLLSSIAWWLVLSAWVIITIYMSKGSMSLLRGYCLFHELKPYMKIYAESNKSVQETVRSIDKKSNYRFPFIDPPMNIEENENDKILEDKDLKTTQV